MNQKVIVIKSIGNMIGDESNIVIWVGVNKEGDKKFRAFAQFNDVNDPSFNPPCVESEHIYPTIDEAIIDAKANIFPPDGSEIQWDDIIQN